MLLTPVRFLYVSRVDKYKPLYAPYVQGDLGCLGK